MDEFPYKKFINNTVFVSEEDYRIINRSRQIYLKTNFVSSEFIRRILIDNVYFKYALKYLNGDIDEFKVAYINHGDIIGRIGYTRSEIVLALNIYMKENNIKDEESLLKYQTLCSLIGLDALKKKYSNEIIECKIENNDYKINIGKIINFLEKSNYDLKMILDDENVSEIGGIPKMYFIYATLEFLNNNNVVDNYVLPSNMDLNIKDLANNYVDVEAINQLLKTEDTLYSKIKLQDELINIILKDMPDDLNELAKSIYIYIMLCKTLTYDEEFYALDEEGEVTLKHQDYHRVEEINLKNNRVTCYEFNLIYAKFLDMFGIHFKSEYRGSIDEAGYGLGHANLVYRTGKYIVLADSTEGILEGDIAGSKINNVLTGIRVLNKNHKTKEEFQETMDMVYNLIKEKDNTKLDSLDSLVSEYQKKTDNYHNIDFNTKIEILLSKIKGIKHTGVDAMVYLLHLKKILFNYEEQRFNIKINIVADKRYVNEDQLARLTAIIRFNENDLEDDNTKYYVFTPNLALSEISFDELKKLFISDELSYLERDINHIPNIERGNVK